MRTIKWFIFKQERTVCQTGSEKIHSFHICLERKDTLLSNNHLSGLEVAFCIAGDKTT